MLEKQNTENTLTNHTLSSDAMGLADQQGVLIPEAEEDQELAALEGAVDGAEPEDTPAAPVLTKAALPVLPLSSSPVDTLKIDHTFFYAILEEGVEKYVVRPHPLRGFRQWIVRRKPFNAVTRALNFWCDGSMESLTINDLIGTPNPSLPFSLPFRSSPPLSAEIFHSMVPRSDLEQYRIMRILPTAAHRLGLTSGQELNGTALAKIFQSALEVRLPLFAGARCCCLLMVHVQIKVVSD